METDYFSQSSIIEYEIFLKFIIGNILNQQITIRNKE